MKMNIGKRCERTKEIANIKILDHDQMTISLQNII